MTAANRRRRVLLVEDEALIALDLAAMLEAAGMDVLGPEATLARALAAAQTTDADAAVLDVSLAREHVWPAAEILISRGVPVIFLTGFSADAFPPAFAQLPRLPKPCTPEILIASLSALLER